MTSIDTATLRVNDPAELIDTVAYLLGFHPCESLVVLGFSGAASSPRRVEITVRQDIAAGSADEADYSCLFEALQRAEVNSVAAIWFSDITTADPRLDRLLMQRTELFLCAATACGLEVLDVLSAAADRWWSLLCGEKECCPAEGNPRTTGTGVVAAEAAFAGMVALADRETVQDQLTGRPASAREQLGQLVTSALAARVIENTPEECGEPSARTADDVSAWVGFAELLQRPSGNANGLAAQQLATLGAYLLDLRVRDQLWLMIDNAELQAERLLQLLHSQLPAPFDAPAMFLFGWSRWRAGNGTVAAMAAEQCLVSDPHYSAARLLLTAVRSGLDPRRVPPLRSSLS